jgi:hypothetical protein
LHDRLLDEFEFLPGRLGGILYRRVKFDKRDLIAVFPRVADEQICYGHDCFPLFFPIDLRFVETLNVFIILVITLRRYSFSRSGQSFCIPAGGMKSAVLTDCAFYRFVRRCKDQLSFSLLCRINCPHALYELPEQFESCLVD